MIHDTSHATLDRPVFPVAGRRSRVVRRASTAQAKAGFALLLGVFVFTVFEGAVRKWVFPDFALARNFTYLVKDFLFVGAAFFGWSLLHPAFRRRVTQWSMILAITLLPATLINFGGTSIAALLLGLRAYVILPVAAFFVAGVIRSLVDIQRIFVVVGISTIVVAFLGWAQFYSPPDHFLNHVEVAGEQLRTIFDRGHVRANGSFYYVTGMGLLCAVGVCSGMFFLLSGSKGQRAMGVAFAVAGGVCGAVSMHRGGILMAGLIIAGSLMLFHQIRYSLALGFLTIPVFLVFGPTVADQMADMPLLRPLHERFVYADTFSERGDYALMNIRLGITRHPVGAGIGRGQAGAAFLDYGDRASGAYETELGRVPFEVGIPGLLGVLFFRFATLVLLWRQMQQTTDRRVRALLAVVIPLFLFFSLNYMTFNHTGSSFAWALAALGLATVNWSAWQEDALPNRRGSLRARPEARGPRGRVHRA